MLLAPALLLASGCANQSPPISQTQTDALQVRETEASQEPTFRAVSNALFDSGYQVMVSDPEAGILTAQKRVDPAPAADATVITLTVVASLLSGQDMVRDLPPEYHAVSAVVNPLPGGRSSVRVQMFVDGIARPEQSRVDELWVLVQRQLLMKEPSAGAVAPPLDTGPPGRR